MGPPKDDTDSLVASRRKTLRMLGLKDADVLRWLSRSCLRLSLLGLLVVNGIYFHATTLLLVLLIHFACLDFFTRLIHCNKPIKLCIFQSQNRISFLIWLRATDIDSLWCLGSTLYRMLRKFNRFTVLDSIQQHREPKSLKKERKCAELSKSWLEFFLVLVLQFASSYSSLRYHYWDSLLCP